MPEKPRKPGVPPGRKGIDWERIERQYRAGQLSVSEIGRQHGIAESGIRKRAKQEGWSRDLTGQVRNAVKARLLSERIEGVAQENERQIVDEASAAAVQVVRRHQQHFARLAEFAETMTIHGLRTAKGLKAKVDVTGQRESLADVLQKVAVATARYVPLERRAWSIDDAGTGEDLASWLKAQTGLD